jgi:hypothetical protein
MPTNVKKRKAVSNCRPVAPLPEVPPSRKRGAGATNKSSLATRSMESLLHNLHAATCEKQESESANLAVIDVVQSSPMLISAMLRCHERFVRVVATELSVSTATTSGKDPNDTSTKIHRIGESHVQNAMEELGLHDILMESKRIQASVDSSEHETVGDVTVTTKRKRKVERRVKQWTDEEISEQERLLASSKEKLLRGGD